MDRSEHALCSLASALSLVAGKNVRVPERAYPARYPSRLARLFQVGYGACNLPLFLREPSILVSGDRIEYLTGEVEYFADHILQRSLRSLVQGHTFFVVSGVDPTESIAGVTGCDRGPAPRLYLSAHCVVIVMANWNGAPAVLHYGTCDEAVAEVERQVNGLGIAASDPTIRHLVPRLMGHSIHANGSVFSVQSRLPGRSSEFSWRRIDTATELWLSRKPTKEFGGSFLAEHLQQLLELLPSFRDSLAPAKDGLLKWCDTTRMPGGVTHGDFWLGNVLFSGDAVSGIVDWECAQTDGLGLIDVMYMILMSYAMAHGFHIAHCLRELWADEINDGALQARITDLHIKSGLDKDDLKFIALLLWFGHLRQHALRGTMPSVSWTEDMIPHSVPVITKWLSRHAEARPVRATTT